MDALIVFGTIMFIMAIFLRKQLKWEVDLDSCNIEQEKKDVKLNKIWWNILFWVGGAMVLVVIIGIILI